MRFLFFPQRAVLEHGTHHADQIVSRGHGRDLLAVGVVALNARRIDL